MAASHYSDPDYQRNRALVIAQARREIGPVVPCSLCGGPVSLDLGGRQRGSVSVDHIVPLDQGGTHDVGNLAICHMGCNARRGSRYRAMKHGNRIGGRRRGGSRHAMVLREAGGAGF